MTTNTTGTDFASVSCYQQRHPNRSQYPNKHTLTSTLSTDNIPTSLNQICPVYSAAATSSTTQTCHTFTSAFPQATLLPASVIPTLRHHNHPPNSQNNTQTMAAGTQRWREAHRAKTQQEVTTLQDQSKSRSRNSDCTLSSWASGNNISAFRWTTRCPH